MKILWAKTDFLHPATKGGHIRTLEILRRLHRNHEIHYVAFDDPERPEGARRSFEYATRSYPVEHRVPGKSSPEFAAQLVAGLFSQVPVAVSRYRSLAMEREIAALLARERFDKVVCDYLAPSGNIPNLSRCVLFQHNVETAIWQRHVEHAAGVRRLYFRLQAGRMFRYERDVCRAAGRVLAVSPADAALMGRLFDIPRPAVVPTGVDIDYFAPTASAAPAADLVFVGSMDWLPNVEAVGWFAREILPLIRRRRPQCSLAVVGRSPMRKVTELAESDPLIRVTGTIPDIRPWLWGSMVSIVPVRIGSGTRLKIFESMAAKIPVVSTAVGAEGLEVSSPGNIRLADTPVAFAEACLELLENPAERARIASAAWELVSSRFSWDRVTESFLRALG